MAKMTMPEMIDLVKNKFRDEDTCFEKTYRCVAERVDDYLTDDGPYSWREYVLENEHVDPDVLMEKAYDAVLEDVYECIDIDEVAELVGDDVSNEELWEFMDAVAEDENCVEAISSASYKYVTVDPQDEIRANEEQFKQWRREIEEMNDDYWKTRGVK